MMRNIAFPCIIMMLVLVTGCSQENTDQQAAQEAAPAVQEEVLQLTTDQQEIVDKAVALAKAIDATPDATAGVLAEFAISTEELNDLFYEIAASPALTSAYQEALGE